MKFEEIKTRRLILRKLTPEVYKFVFENLSEEELVEFFGLDSSADLFTEENRYRKGLATFNKSVLIFQLVDALEKNVIGWCGFHTWYLDHFRAELGYMLTNDKYKDKALMSEALASVIDYGFQKMNLHRIEAMVGAANIPSLKLMEKFKFKKEGHLREHYFKNNRMEDSLVFSLLKSEYAR
ncbi:MAG TPA: GNAT family protein [Bacteroidia bacterium]